MKKNRSGKLARRLPLVTLGLMFVTLGLVFSSWGWARYVMMGAGLVLILISLALPGEWQQ